MAYDRVWGFFFLGFWEGWDLLYTPVLLLLLLLLEDDVLVYVHLFSWMIRVFIIITYYYFHIHNICFSM
jgi:hypothetical protein